MVPISNGTGNPNGALMVHDMGIGISKEHWGMGSVMETPRYLTLYSWWVGAG